MSIVVTEYALRYPEGRVDRALYSHARSRAQCERIVEEMRKARMEPIPTIVTRTVTTTTTDWEEVQQ